MNPPAAGPAAKTAPDAIQDRAEGRRVAVCTADGKFLRTVTPEDAVAIETSGLGNQQGRSIRLIAGLSIHSLRSLPTQMIPDLQQMRTADPERYRNWRGVGGPKVLRIGRYSRGATGRTGGTSDAGRTTR